MKKGELIIIPTDTVYGLCAKLFDEEGLKNIYKLKTRDLQKQIPILVGNIEQAEEIAIISTQAMKIINAFWPGALTIVFKTTKDFYLKTKEETIALRMPNHKLALKLLNEFGPLRATSVNKSNEAPLLDYKSIYENYHNDVKTIYEQNEPQSNVSSTVIDMTSELKVLRVGTITKEELLEAIKSHD